MRKLSCEPSPGPGHCSNLVDDFAMVAFASVFRSYIGTSCRIILSGQNELYVVACGWRERFGYRRPDLSIGVQIARDLGEGEQETSESDG
jgi:hypothetical protein